MKLFGVVMTGRAQWEYIHVFYGEDANRRISIERHVFVAVAPEYGDSVDKSVSSKYMRSFQTLQGVARFVIPHLFTVGVKPEVRVHG